MDYDGVLAYGRVIRDLYLANGWALRAWTWHEAADTRIFYPRPAAEKEGDVVWIGNWGDDERTAELHEFLLEPVAALKLRARVRGVRYPPQARQALAAAGIDYAGWLPNYDVPQTFAQFKFTVHIPRRPYAQTLPGVPTIRPFEALACGIPLISAPWEDVENLFTPGKDFLVARNGRQMQQHMRALLYDCDMAYELAVHGRQTLMQRHTCAHRVDELIQIYGDLTASEPRQKREESHVGGHTS
jgi:spore maturation protein CgeB